jgi:site-specific DNA recombinase
MTASMLAPIAAIMARKSTDQTGVVDEEKSVTRQVEQAKAYAVRKGWVVDERYIFTDDGVSGAEFVKRPGLLRLLSLLSPRPPFQRLIMSEESRLGREQIETAYILKRILDAGVRVFFYLEDRERTLDNPMDKIVLSLQHFASEMERERARLRTYDAMARKAQAGHVTGGRVYGYDNVDVFAPEPGADGRPRRLFVTRRINEAQAAIVRRIFALCAQGNGLTKIAKALNADRIAPPRSDAHGWAGTAVREILHRELYRGVVVWNKTQKIMRGGTRRQRRRPPSEWLRRPAEELRIISDAAWEAAHKRVAGTRNTFRPRPGQSAARLDLTSPYLLSGLGRCAFCGGSVIAMSRHHGRRRGFFYGCAYNSKRGPTICRNNVHMPQQVLEEAVIDSIAASFDEAEVAAAIDRALELLEERRAASREGRSSHEEALRIVRAEESRLIDAVKQGQELNALIAALDNAQERRRTLEAEIAAFSSAAIDRLPDPERLRDALTKRAADIRRVLTRREPAVRRVLQSVIAERLEFAPFNDGEVRGYQFTGTGSYAEELLGDTCPTSSGGPNGIRTRVPTSPHAFASESMICGVLSQ